MEEAVSPVGANSLFIPLPDKRQVRKQPFPGCGPSGLMRYEGMQLLARKEDFAKGTAVAADHPVMGAAREAILEAVSGRYDFTGCRS